MSLGRVQEHFKGLLGRRISQASMLKYMAQVSFSLKEWEKRSARELLSAKVIYVDETGHRVSGKNYWVHSYSSRDIVLQFIHQHRGREGIDEIGILPKCNQQRTSSLQSSYHNGIGFLCPWMWPILHNWIIFVRKLDTFRTVILCFYTKGETSV